MATARKRSPWQLATSVPRQVLAHPANEGRPGRALAGAFGWQLRKRVRNGPVRLRAYGLDIELPSWSGSLSNYFYFGECFEWTTVNFMRHYLQPGDVVVDAGANVGMFTYAAVEVVGQDGRVIALEPMPAAAAVLEANVERNRLGGVVSVHRAAVAGEPGTASFTTDLDVSNHLSWSSGASVSRESAEVALVPLDDVVPAGPVALTKLDLEGAEMLALRGYGAHLADGSARVLIVEAHDHALVRMGSSREEVLRELAASGYDTFAYDVAARRLVVMTGEEQDDVIAVAPDALDEVVERLARAAP